MSTQNREAWGPYCREDDHDRCAMSPCGCPHHDEGRVRVAPTAWNGLAAVEPGSRAIRNWAADFRVDAEGRRICETCEEVLPPSKGGRYPRQCAECKASA